MDNMDDKNPKSNSGTTPLHLAVKGKEIHAPGVAVNGNLPMYQLIIKNAVEKNPKCEDWGRTPFHLAAFHGNFPICQFYMKNFENKSPKDRFGQTPLHLAAKMGHLELFKFMREEVEDKNPISRRFKTPYDLAKEEGHTAICALIESSK